MNLWNRTVPATPSRRATRPKNPSGPAPERSVVLIADYGLPVLIATIVFFSFLPVLSNDFVNWDDTSQFIENPHYRGLSWSHLKWMFTTFGFMGHYQPVTWLTHGLVYTIWGMDPFGYHFVNLLLHVANAILFYFLTAALLRRLWGPGKVSSVHVHAAAAVGALFFAIHPLRVEAVAWANERREVLSAFFVLLTLLAYLRGEKAGRRWLLLSVATYALAMLSKVMAMTLPVILLALDLYPLGRFTDTGGRIRIRARLVTEKLPYAAIAGGAAALGLINGAPEGLIGWAKHNLIQRTMQAAYGLCFYLWKTVWPVGLSPLYPLEDSLDPTQPRYITAALLVVAITAALIALRRRYPGALMAWGCYAVIVSPVLGFAQGGPQIAADRYTYLACMPWAILVAAGAGGLWRTVEARGFSRQAQLSLAMAIAATLAALSIRTYQQSGLWKDSVTLWEHAIQVDPTNYEAYTGRGDARLTNGNLDGALADFDAALRLKPADHYALHKRGYLRQLRGDLDGAIADYSNAFIHRPVDAAVYYSRGRARFLKNDFAGAIADFTDSLRLRPENAEAYYNRGNAQKALGNFDAALSDYTHAIRLQPHPSVYNKRGAVRQAKGDLDGALADYTQAVELTPPGSANRSTFERNLADVRRLLTTGSNTP